MIYIQSIFIYLILVIIWAAYRIIVYKKNKEITILREAAVNIFFLYFLLLLGYTIFKDINLAITFDKYGHGNFIPLKETLKMFGGNGSGVRRGLYNVIGNILLFVPFGFFIPLLFEKYNNILKVAFYGFIVSLFIEVLQYFTARNITDIDDIIFNTCGSVLGIISFKIFNHIVKALKLEHITAKVKNVSEIKLFKAVIKPISAMLLCSSIFILYSIYSGTYSSKISNEQFAVEAFAINGSKNNTAVVKEFNQYKLFLKDYDRYMELSTFKKVFFNRYVLQDNRQANLRDINYGYSIATMEDNRKNTIGIVVFGKNRGAETIIITFKGKVYKEEIPADNYFIAVYPEFKERNEKSDIYNIFNNESSKDLQVRFLDESGNEYKDLQLIK